MRCKGTPSFYGKFTNRSGNGCDGGSWSHGKVVLPICGSMVDVTGRYILLTWTGWDFWGKVGIYDTWILWVMESYPPRPACFVKGWSYFDTLESLERPTTLLFWWLLSNHLPLLKADSPEGFFSSFKHQFSGGEGFVSRRVWWSLVWDVEIDLFLFGVGV